MHNKTKLPQPQKIFIKLKFKTSQFKADNHHSRTFFTISHRLNLGEPCLQKMDNTTLSIILCITLPCLMTTLGACLVFFFKRTSKIVNMITIGLASGIMLSASIWSLLIPAVDYSEEYWSNLYVLPVVLGFVLGAVFMILLDFVCSKFFKAKKEAEKEKAFKLFTAITIHNIPEGMSVGFAIGTAVAMSSPTLSAVMFAVGIALQNFPEGLATALPIQNCLHNKQKSFWLATLSGVIEPIFAILGFFLATYISSLLPWLLAFSAGAMIYVIVEEMIPEIQMDGKASWGSWSFVIGFVLMMILDILL